MNDFGCYIHVPFCAGGKCPYCAFYSVTYSPHLADSYFKALIEQIRRIDVLKIDTIYIGGGTPTLLGGLRLREMISRIRDTLPVSEQPEITIEASPETITDKMADHLAAAGITRISLGMQSMVNKQLRVLERRHTVEQSIDACELLRPYSFSISFDLLFGIPNQTLEDWDRSLRRAIGLNPDHISVYNLSYEEGTPFALGVRTGIITPVGSNNELKMYRAAVELLRENGYGHYEISNFSKPGAQSKHNLKYWEGKGYIGLGPAANSYIPGPPRWIRIAAVSDVRAYINAIERLKDPWEMIEFLDLPMRSAEFLLLRLRLTKGFSTGDVENQLKNVDPLEYIAALRPLIEDGFLVENAGRISIPEERIFVSNSIILKAVELTEKLFQADKPEGKDDKNDPNKYARNFRGPDQP